MFYVQKALIEIVICTKDIAPIACFSCVRV